MKEFDPTVLAPGVTWGEADVVAHFNDQMLVREPDNPVLLDYKKRCDNLAAGIADVPDTRFLTESPSACNALTEVWEHAAAWEEADSWRMWGKPEHHVFVDYCRLYQRDVWRALKQLDREQGVAHGRHRSWAPSRRRPARTASQAWRSVVDYLWDREMSHAHLRGFPSDHVFWAVQRLSQPDVGQALRPLSSW